MNEKQRVAQSPGMGLGDILYIILRHKWKILAILVLGGAAALSVPRFMPIPYESEAKLYIRYVLETKAPSQLSQDDGRIKSLGAGGESIINTELEILTSRDLAQRVAVAIGPDRLVGAPATNSLARATDLIHRGVKAEVVQNSSVVRVVFQNEDQGLVQPVLSQLVSSYFKQHAEIHAVGVFDEFLTQETDQRRSQLVQTEEELRKARGKLGINSLEDTKKTYSEMSSRMEQQIFDAEAELAERRAAAKELGKLAPEVPLALTNNGPVTNSAPPVPAEAAARYRAICNLLDSLSKKEQELLLTFTPASSFVKDVQERIEANIKIRKQLEMQNPGLVVMRVGETNPVALGNGADPQIAIAAEMSRVRGLEARIKELKDQLEQVRKKATALNDAEGPITELQRQKGLQESYFTRFSQNLEQSQIDEKLGAGKVSNISIVEEPTPAQKTKSKLAKVEAGLLFGSVAAAFGLAFLIDLFVDQSIKRPAEVESKLELPLFLSMPRIKRNGHIWFPGPARRSLAERNKEKPRPEQEHPAGSADLTLAAPHGVHPLSRYYEALRDRLISYFEMENLTHKPKLIAITSCADGSGVSTTAAGLASALSEVGDGNVLLVNMREQNGAAHHFHKGELASGLEQALETDKRGGALIQENLYAVSEVAGGELLVSMLPKRFSQLVPRLKASDFDYIIFDMPPVSQISLTPRLAKFMDVVLLVIESERTPFEVAKKARALLTRSNAKVGVVMNKERRYVPQWLRQDI